MSGGANNITGGGISQAVLFWKLLLKKEKSKGVG
jgi:hypothetical protein